MMMNLPLTSLQTVRTIPCLASSFRQLSVSPSMMLQLDMPKKPMTPWITYYTKNFAAIKKSLPTVPTAQLMKKLSEDFKRMPEQEKAEMQQVYQKQMEMYSVKLAKVPQDVLDKMKSLKKAKRAMKAGSQGKTEALAELRSLQESLEKPKKPANPYIMFMNDRRSNMSSSGLIPAEQTKQLAKEWSQAGTAVKEKYDKAFAKLSAKYKKDLEKWNTEMNENGKIEELNAAQMKLTKAKRNVRKNML